MLEDSLEVMKRNHDSQELIRKKLLNENDEEINHVSPRDKMPFKFSIANLDDKNDRKEQTKFQVNENNQNSNS